ncbi:MAG: restriction endonuclease subunit S [Acidimicrobiales bacterium]
MTAQQVPLKHLAGINERALPDDTDPDRTFRYIDIASVGHGELAKEPDEVRFEDAPSRARRLLREGDTIVSTVRTYLRAVWPVDGPTDDLVASTGFAVLTPRGIDSSYFSWWVQSDVFIEEVMARSAGVSYPAINALELGELMVRVPSLMDQRAIADFLDTETARIDALITKKRRLIAILHERFDSYIRYRLASVEPRLPLKRRWSVIDCKHRTPDYLPAGYPVISPGDVTPGRLNLDRAHRFVGEADYLDLADATRRPRRGDVIYSRNASIGIASYVDTDRPFCMGQDVCLITSREQDQLYLSYVLNSVGVDQLDVQKIGSTFSRVNVAQILELEIPVPEPRVQRWLRDEFDASKQRHDATVRLLDRQISLLHEHRQALITAAVTGELEVPGVAA